jgi:hypothetical protein
MQKEARRRIPKLPTVCRTIVLLLYVCQRFFYSIISFLKLTPSHDTTKANNNDRQQLQPPTTTANSQQPPTTANNNNNLTTTKPQPYYKDKTTIQNDTTTIQQPTCPKTNKDPPLHPLKKLFEIPTAASP